MLEKLRKVFMNDKAFLGATVASAGLYVLAAILMSFVETNGAKYFDLLVDMARGAAIVCLYFSYKNHDKNVMKGLIGLLLGTIFAVDAFYFASSSNMFGYLITLCLDVLLIVNHFIINSDHHSSPEQVLGNQVLILGCAVLILVNLIPTLAEIVKIPNSALWAVATVMGALASLCADFIIVCIESRLDAYRLQREANGWTENK